VPLAEGEYFASHQREMRRAYYAAISYVDSLVGELLQVLDDEGVANDTIVSM
jgi:iduronate 2-sulfatase